MSTMNLAHFEVATRGGVKQRLARHGVRVQHGPGALGGHRCVLYHVFGELERLTTACETFGGRRWFAAVEAHSSFSDPSTSLRSA